jgi:hypothetical protein
VENRHFNNPGQPLDPGFNTEEAGIVDGDDLRCMSCCMSGL